METFEEFKVFAREKYKEFDSDAEWLDYIYSYIDQYTLSCLPLIWMRILICWIQYNELRYRGFNDNVGEVEIREKTDRKDKNGKAIYDKKSLEVDFIASLGSQKYYVQSALSITDEEEKM